MANPGDDATTLASLREEVEAFVAERDWQQFHSRKNLSMALAIEAAELMDHYKWVETPAEDSSPLDAYVALYAAERDRTVYLEVGVDGRLRENGKVATQPSAVTPGRNDTFAVLGVLVLIFFALTQALAAFTDNSRQSDHLVFAAILGSLAVAIVVWLSRRRLT